MKDSNTVTAQDIIGKSVDGGHYVSVDNIVKYCRTAPLLELPLDFKEWYNPTPSNPSQFYPV